MEEEFLIEQKESGLRVFLADIVLKNVSQDLLEDRMSELENLVETFGGVVILRKYQRKDKPDNKTYIGKGKLEEIIADMQALGANILIIGNILKPRQLYEISEKLRPIGCKVWDRVDLILKIFGKHADSMEARLQIELAAIRHMGPRIFGMGMELSRQGGGIGTSGIGETNTERMKRHLKEKQIKIRKKLEEYERMRSLHRDSRKRKNLPTVGIVGYTNVGKSSLLNLITKKNVLAENKLFATLGTNVGKMFMFLDDTMTKGKEVLLNDTIGFIRDLPPQLIEAFSSTLEDSIESDILLQIIDASDSFLDERMSIVDEILNKIGAKQPKLFVFNKIDLLEKEKLAEIKEKYRSLTPVFISVNNGDGIEELKNKILQMLQSLGKL